MGHEDAARQAELDRQQAIVDAVKAENDKNAPKDGEARSISWADPGFGLAAGEPDPRDEKPKGKG